MRSGLRAKDYPRGPCSQFPRKEHQSVQSERAARNHWLIAVVALVIVFVAGNWPLAIGADAPQGDAQAIFAPAYTLIADHARSGRILTWNPWDSAGAPDYADPEWGASSPVTVAAGAITGGTERGFRFYYLSIWLLGPVGLLLLARDFGVSPWAAWVVALGFAFSGFYIGNAMHTSSIYSFSWVPLIVWRFDVALASRRFIPALQAGSLWGLSSLGGYPELTILTAGFLLLWTVGRHISGGESDSESSITGPRNVTKSSWTVPALCLAAVAFVGCAIVAPAYAAFFSEGRGYSDRVGPRSRIEATTSNTTPVGAFTSFSSPSVALLTRRLWPNTHPTMTSIYVGPIITILAILALSDRPRSKWRWWLFAVAVFFLLCAVGNQLPVRGWLYDAIRPTRYFRNAALFREYAMFCASLLALIALMDLEKARPDEFAIWKRLLWIATIAGVGAITAYACTVRRVDIVLPWLHQAVLQLVVGWAGAIVIAMIVLLAPRSRKMFLMLLTILALTDAQMTIALMRPMVSRHGLERSIWDQLNAAHNTSLDLTRKGLARQLRPDYFFYYANNHNVVSKTAMFENNDTLRNRFQEDFRVHPVLTGMSTGADRIWFATKVAILPPTDHFYSAFVRRSESLGAPVILVHRPADMPLIRERDITTPTDSAGTRAILSLPAAEHIAANVLRYTPDHLDVRVNCPEPGWLLVTDRWSNGWRVSVNGRRGELFGGDVIFRAVQVERGENTVNFYYAPFGFPGLVILSWGTIAAVWLVPMIFHKARSE
jgi:hypothetical protein